MRVQRDVKVQDFLQAIQAVCQLYGYSLRSCGCCEGLYTVSTRTGKSTTVGDINDPESAEAEAKRRRLAEERNGEAAYKRIMGE